MGDITVVKSAVRMFWCAYLAVCAVEVDGIGLAAIIAYQDLRKLASDALSQGIQLQQSVYIHLTSKSVLSRDQFLARRGVQRRQHRVFTTMLKLEFVEGAFSLTFL